MKPESRRGQTPRPEEPQKELDEQELSRIIERHTPPVDDGMTRTELPNGASMRVDERYKSSSKRKNTRRRGGGRSSEDADDVEEEVQSDTESEQELFESLTEGIARNRQKVYLTYHELDRMGAQVWANSGNSYTDEQYRASQDFIVAYADYRDHIDTHPTYRSSETGAMLAEVGLAELVIAKGERFEKVLRATPEAVVVPEEAPEVVEEILTSADTTRSEKLRSLREALGLSKERPVSPKGLYEVRAEKFAEKHGITSERDAVYQRENEYKKALRANFKKKDKAGVAAAKAEYHKALYAWRMKLERVAETLEDGTGRSEKKEALVLQKRDTILRPTNLEAEMRAEMLNERGKTALGKVLNWGAQAPKVALSAVNAPTNFLGKGMAWMFHKGARGKSLESSMQMDRLSKHYARGIRIVGGAAIGTALALSASPVTATAAGVTFLVFTARGAFGLASGMGAGYGSGKLYERFIGSDTRYRLKRRSRAHHYNEKDFTSSLEQYASGRAVERAKHKARLQITSAFVAGGAAGLLSNPVAEGILDRFDALESVQDAGTGAEQDLDQTNETPDPVTPPAEQGGGVTNLVEKAPEEIDTSVPGDMFRETVIEAHSGDGFNHLFARLDTSNIENPSAVVQHLRALSPTELSQEVRALEDGVSVDVYGGDRLWLDEHQNLWFTRDGQDQLLMSNNDSVEQGYVVQRLPESMLPAPSTPEEVVVQDVQPQASAPQAETTIETPVQVEQAPTAQVEEDRAPEYTPEVVADMPPVEETRTETPGVQYMGDYIQTESPAARTAEVLSDSATASGVGTEGVTTLEDYISQPTNSAEVITNVHNVEVNSAEPAAYTWRVPGTNLTYPVAYGGTPEQYAEWARQHVENRPGAIFYFATPIRDSFGVVTSMRIDAWDAGLDGVPRLNEGMINPDTRQPLPPPNPNDFISRLP